MQFVYDDQGEGDLSSWPHHFLAKPDPVPSQDKIAEVLCWVLQNYGAAHAEEDQTDRIWDWNYDRPYYRFVFANHADAMAFKLRWG